MAPRIDIAHDSALVQLSAWRSRLAGRMIGAVSSGDGEPSLLVENHLVVPKADADRMRTTDQARSVDYQPVLDIPPPEGFEAAEIDPPPPFEVVSFDGAEIALDSLERRASSDGSCSSRRAAGTLAYAARLQDQGIRAMVDWVGTPHAVLSTSSAEQGGQDAYTWAEVQGRTGLRRAFQLVEALARIGRSPQRVRVGILDSGFWFDRTTGMCLAPAGVAPEFAGRPDQYDLASSVYVAGGPSLAAGARWHGQGTAAISVAPHGNRAGIAGAGGQLADPVLFRTDLSSLQIARAVRSTPEWRIAVLNMSFGTTLSSSFLALDDEFEEDIYNRAFEYAHDHGVVLVAAAGNAGSNLPEDIDVRPACRTPGVTTVGALAANDSDRAWSGSNYGDSVRIWAPGENLNAGPYPPTMGLVSDVLYTFTGTSGAAPLVAGTAALLKALDPTLTADQVRDMLTDTGWRGSSDPRVRVGLDAGAAVWRAMKGRLPDNLAGPGALTPDGSGSLGLAAPGARSLPTPSTMEWHSFRVDRLASVRIEFEHAAEIGPAKLHFRPEDAETSAFETLSETIGGDRHVIDIGIAPPGSYRLLVVGGPTVYTLKVTLAPVAIGSDEFETNDSMDSATAFSFSPSVDWVGEKEEPITGFPPTGPIKPWVVPLAYPPGSYQMTLHSGGDIDYLVVRDVPAPAGDIRAWINPSSLDAPITVEILDMAGTVRRREVLFHESAQMPLISPECYVRISSAAPTRYSFAIARHPDYSAGIPPLKIPVGELAPWHLDAPMRLSSWQDHYELSLGPGTRVPGLTASGSPGVVLQVTDLGGEVVAFGETTASGATVWLDDLADGAYLLRVGRTDDQRQMGSGRWRPLDFRLVPELTRAPSDDPA